VLFHALTGHPAFTGKSLAQIVSAKISGEVPNLSSEVQDLRRGVSDLTADLLARDKDRRPQSYAEIVRRCDDLLAGRAVASAGSRMPLIIGVVVAALAVIVGVVATISGKTQPSTPGPAAISPPVSVVTAPPAAAIAFGAPRALDLAGDFLGQAGGWTRIGDAVWVLSEEAEHTIVGQSGRMERPLDDPAVRIEGILHLTAGDQGTRQVAIGVLLDDGSEVALGIKNTGDFLAQVEIVKGAQSKRLERTQSIPAEDAPFSFTVQDGVLSVVVSKLKLNPLPIPGGAKKLFVSMVGPGSASIIKLTASHPKP
jgi:hypothetical protein